ncbi:MAG: hypothetical protein ACK5LJ_14945 [Paracoccus sp. (in: a-proteobacteria)]
MSTRYVRNADGKGWLLVRHDISNAIYPPLPQYLKVAHLGTANGREHFRIMEGKSRGKTASVSLRSDGTSYLSRVPPRRRTDAVIRFRISTGELWYGSKGPFSAKTDPSNPPPVGTHELEIPYEYHSLGSGYEPYSKYAGSWFRIGHKGDRFLHPGRVSLGCATLTNVTEWTNVYNYLISARKDDVSVGIIRVEA